MLKVYVNIEKAKKYDGLNVEVISEKEYGKRCYETYLKYYKSLEVFQTFVDLRIGKKDFENPESIMQMFSDFCEEKAEDEMYAKWEEMEVVGA